MNFTVFPKIVPSFFYSSRRRHTRCSRDWSSDVCSSDLDRLLLPDRVLAMCQDLFHYLLDTGGPEQKTIIFCARDRHADDVAEIGRASCRERVENLEAVPSALAYLQKLFHVSTTSLLIP